MTQHSLSLRHSLVPLGGGAFLVAVPFGGSVLERLLLGSVFARLYALVL